MTGYILDRRACIEVLRGRRRDVADRIASAEGGCCISAVTLAELVQGARCSANPERAELGVRLFAASLCVLPFDSPASSEYADICASMKRNEVPIGMEDLLVAAQARSADKVLVTDDVRRFDRIPGLKVEGWCGPGAAVRDVPVCGTVTLLPPSTEPWECQPITARTQSPS